MGVVDGKSICQIALVVRDIKSAVKHYAALFGVPEPEIFGIAPLEQAKTSFRGELTPTQPKLAVFDLGQVVLELTEPDEHPSSWKTFLEEHGDGVHHIGFRVGDREKAVRFFEEEGMPVRHYGEYPGGNYTFMDSEAKLGVLVNIKYEPEGQPDSSAT